MLSMHFCVPYQYQSTIRLRFITFFHTRSEYKCLCVTQVDNIYVSAKLHLKMEIYRINFFLAPIRRPIYLIYFLLLDQICPTRTEKGRRPGTHAEATPCRSFIPASLPVRFLTSSAGILHPNACSAPTALGRKIHPPKFSDGTRMAQRYHRFASWAQSVTFSTWQF